MNPAPALPIAPKVSRYSDGLLAVGMIGILCVMLVPLPPFVMDIAIALNIAWSLVVMLITLTLREPLEFSTFPSLLLFTTLYRLALNVASTRLILSNGSAGRVIDAFGSFVVGGNLAIGFVIFIILLIIQFVVITKGSSRISEVAARFTLDAMPGKQMAIDADLNAGLITEEIARKRREAISAEAEFYGAMDGAGKFVRGDAVASLIITLTNIVGGIAVGLLNDMSISEALQRYAILTIGDGLVSQLPALLVSMASGFLVTKTRSKEKLANELSGQFYLSPSALRISGGIVFALGFLPDIPLFPFAVLAAGLAFAGMRADRQIAAKNAPKPIEAPPEPANAAELTPEALTELLKVDRMGVEIGYRLIPLVDQERRGNLLDHIAMVRKQFAQLYGFVVPPIRMRDNLSLEPNQYRVLCSGQEVGRGELYPGSLLAMNPGHVQEKISGVATKDPTFGLPAVWIQTAKKSEAELLGYTCVDPESVLVTHLTEIIKDHAHEILSREDVQAALLRAKESNATVVGEIGTDTVPLGTIQRVLCNLLKERVPIRNLITILECLADFGKKEKDPDALTELVRQRLSRSLCELHTTSGGKIEVLTLPPPVEQGLIEAFAGQGDGGGAPSLQRVQEAIVRKWGEVQALGKEPVLLVRTPLRRHLADLFRTQKPPIPVLSYAEVATSGRIESVGLVNVANAAGLPLQPFHAASVS